MTRPHPRSTLFPYTTLFRSLDQAEASAHRRREQAEPRSRADQGEPLECHGNRLRVGALGDPHVHAVIFHGRVDRKSTRLNSSHSSISYAVFCLKKKIQPNTL